MRLEYEHCISREDRVFKTVRIREYFSKCKAGASCACVQWGGEWVIRQSLPIRLLRGLMQKTSNIIYI